MRFNPEALKTAREKKGLSQAGVARKMAIHQTTVAAWETGRAVPGAANILALATLLKKKPDFFFTSTD